MRSIELTFDESLEARIRADWASLTASDLPSLAAHTSPSNSPHITLAAGADLDVGPGVQDLMGRSLPLDIRFAGLVVFDAGRGKFVLARAVVMTRGLLELHAAVHQLGVGAFAHTEPDAWTPHVTLARRISGPQLGAALDALEPGDGGQCAEARMWDSSTRTLTHII